MIDWLIDYLQFYVPLKNFSLIWRRHQCRWRTAKFRPILGAQGRWAGRDLYRVTPAVTRDLDFSGLIRKTGPFRRLLRHTRGCGGSILTRILTGPKDGMNYDVMNYKYEHKSHIRITNVVVFFMVLLRKFLCWQKPQSSKILSVSAC
jgi:hypothetical protein